MSWRYEGKTVRDLGYVASRCPGFEKNPYLIASFEIGSGAPSSNDPKFERRLSGAPWPTFHKSNDAKLFLISILKALESLETFRSGLVGLCLITRKFGPLGDIRRLSGRLILRRAKK
jgi:hypothetical protein